MFLILPLIFMSHLKTRGIFPISPNSSACVCRQTYLEQAGSLCLRLSAASFGGYIPNQFCLIVLSCLATKFTIWIFLPATHNSLPLYPLPSSQSYNNTMLPDATFYLSNFCTQLSTVLYHLPQFVKFFNTFFTKCHLHNISYCLCSVIPPYFHHMHRDEIYVTCHKLECETLQRRTSHTSATTITKLFPHLLGMSIIILPEAQTITYNSLTQK
jgi:hypothetical protein